MLNLIIFFLIYIMGHFFLEVLVEGSWFLVILGFALHDKGGGFQFAVTLTGAKDFLIKLLMP